MATPGMLRTVIVDDEPVARRGLRRLALGHDRVQLVAECRDGVEAVRVIRATEPDLVLLDMQMPGLDGMGVIREIGVEAMPLTIFVTAYDSFAVRAFDVTAVDFVVKPVEETRLRRAIDRAVERHEARRAMAAGGPAPATAGSASDRALAAAPVRTPPVRYATRLMASVGRRSTVIPIEEVVRIQADGYYAWVHTARARHLVRAPLTMLERALDPAMFLRVHRSAIVQVTAIRGFERSPAGRLTLTIEDGARAAVSRSRRAAVVAALRMPVEQASVGARP